MDNEEMLARFRISSRLAYGLIAQSILVICAAIISIWGLFAIDQDFSLRYITNIMSFFVCIALLVYSFIGFNSKRNQEAFFIVAIVLYIIVIILGLLASTIDFKNPVSMLTLITLISTIFFLHEYRINYKVANFAIALSIFSGIIVLIFNMLSGLPWFVALKYIIIPVTIVLTYFERTQRGKYDFSI